LPIPDVAVNTSDPGWPLVSAASHAGRWLDRLTAPVAVTGGTGFVGSHLVDTLCDGGLEPRVLVRDSRAPRWIADRPVQWVEGSLEDSEALELLVDRVGTVVHLAGVVRAGRSGDFDRGNRLGTARLVLALRRRAPEARLVHVSSLAAAGPSPSPDGIGPEAEARPISAYGRSKLAAESEVRSLGSRSWWTILRPPAIYGPRDRDVFEFFRMASKGWMAVPSGERWITVCHVRDVVHAVLAAASHDRPGTVFHLGEPEPYRLDHLLHQVAAAGGLEARIVRVPAAVLRVAGAAGSAAQRLGLRSVALTADKATEILARHWTARTAESLAELGLPPCVRFRQGAEETWAWYRSQGWLR
jgi:nucleoside-diphosphate-sugar epimerase